MDHSRRHAIVLISALILTALLLLRLQGSTFYSSKIRNLPRPTSDEDILFNYQTNTFEETEESVTVKFRHSSKPPPKFTKVPVEKKVEQVPKTDNLRLPDTIEPTEYDLQIKTYLPGYGYEGNDGKNLTFEGEVFISFLVKKDTSMIILNSLELNFTNVHVLITPNGETRFENITLLSVDQKGDEIMIKLKHELSEGTVGKLIINYNGGLRRDMAGLYQTDYVQDGQPKIAIVTQFEPVSTRLMVPCFDEPAFKAVWKVTVIHPKGTVALSNGDQVVSQSVSEEFMKTVFKETPKMSTYLLAIFVSEFKYNEKTTKSGVRVRVWSRPEALKTTKYAVEAGVKCLEYYEEYFGIKFPLNKIDMAAIPDFAAGAMENWGLITYRETDLLYDPKVYTGLHKRRVAVVIAHELAHQWFGNLVTMKWWNDLWLNEGFATFIQYIGTDHISSGHFEMRDEMVRDSQSHAFAADSISSSHPLSVKIDKAEEINDFFDRITYEKGASVIHMISKTIGEKNFKQGIYYFLKKYSYSNANVDDLFNALNEKMGSLAVGPDNKQLDVRTFAEPWLKQIGFPLLNVRRKNSTHIEVRQERFRLSNDTVELEKFQNPKWGYKWDVPVWYTEVNSSLKIKMQWLTRDKPLLIKTSKLAILNINSNGFYRVNYSPDMWESIIDELTQNSKKYSSRTIARLIDDAFMSAYIGILDYQIPIRLLQCSKKEERFLPLSTAMSNIRTITGYYGKDEQRNVIYNFTRKLISDRITNTVAIAETFDYLDSKKFSEVNTALLLVETRCLMDDESCKILMSSLFDKYVLAECDTSQRISSCSEVSAPLRSLAYCYGVKKGGAKVFGKVVKWYKLEENQVEKKYLLNALTCSNDIQELENLLLETMKLEGSMIRKQDVHSLFAGVAHNEIVSDDFLLNFLIDKWELLHKRFAVRSILHSVIDNLVSGVRTEKQLKKLNDFLAITRSTDDYNFKKVVEKIGVKIRWIKAHYDSVLKTFEKATKEIENVGQEAVEEGKQ